MGVFKFVANCTRFHCQPPPAANMPSGSGPMEQKPGQPMMVAQQQPMLDARTVAISPDLPATPTNVTCPSCNQVVQTQVKHEIGLGGKIIVGVFCFPVPCWGFNCLPCCCQACQDAHHSCPRCNNQIGTKKFIM